ncbi:MAG: hypothetical protein V4714_08280 [Bacteroidota bacterium]
MTKIPNLPAIVTIADDDLLPIEDVSNELTKSITVAQLSAKLRGASDQFSAVRTSNTTITDGESRLPYEATGTDITPTLPTATNGRKLWFYNEESSDSNLIIEGINGTITEEIEPGGKNVAIVGNGTVWRYQ